MVHRKFRCWERLLSNASTVRMASSVVKPPFDSAIATLPSTERLDESGEYGTETFGTLRA